MKGDQGMDGMKIICGGQLIKVDEWKGFWLGSRVDTMFYAHQCVVCKKKYISTNANKETTVVCTNQIICNLKIGDSVSVTEKTPDGRVLHDLWKGVIREIDLPCGIAKVEDTSGGSYHGQKFPRHILSLRKVG